MGISKGAGVKDVEGVAGVVHVSAGMAHSCVATRVGEVWCWGWNDDGELGTHGPGSQVPERVPGVSGVVKVAVGAHHSCAIDAAHSVFCWGRNMEGQISTITPGARATPVAVIGIGPPP
jgi:alpha-tubulin suppressor-like RCC1 family protein